MYYDKYDFYLLLKWNNYLHLVKVASKLNLFSNTWELTADLSQLERPYIDRYLIEKIVATTQYNCKFLNVLNQKLFKLENDKYRIIIETSTLSNEGEDEYRIE